MKLSVITPVYNDPRVGRAITSILAQEDVPELELIVVDGGSTDETTTVLQSYRDDIDVLVSEPDDGIYDAMNKGIDLASGDIIGILNADDRYQHSHVLATVADTFRNSAADLCYGDLVYVDDSDSVVRYWKSGPYEPYRFYFGWMPPHPTVFVRKEIYKEFGKFDTTYKIAADYEFLLRTLSTNQVSVSYIDEVLVRMAIGGTSNSSVRNIIKSNIEVYRACDHHKLFGSKIIPIVKLIRKAPQFIQAY